MKLAVVGTGIAGLVAASRLHRAHQITVYEANDRIGGHTNTVRVEHHGAAYEIDTGFIVFNPANYPNFTALLRELGVAWQPSEMSFSVRDDASGLEYNGTSLNTLFAQRRNLFRPSFHRMVRDILRFYRQAGALLEPGAPAPTLGAYLREGGYSQAFVRQHILPMAAAVWSSPEDAVERMPAAFLVRFFHNHGFLQVEDRPQWQVVRGGSHAYVRALVAPFRDRIRSSAPVTRLRRLAAGVEVATGDGGSETYDQVVVAAHGDQALRMLAEPTAPEREILGAFQFQDNPTVLHTDTGVLPRKQRAWASWNYHCGTEATGGPAVSYLMNRLQTIPGPPWFVVSLNREAAIDPAKILARIPYRHPLFTEQAVAAQKRHAEVSGADRIHFCGAYWGYGFHEDGVNSALAVCRRLGVEGAAA